MKHISIFFTLFIACPWQLPAQASGPICGSDTYNQLLAQQDPTYALVLAKYTYEVTPHLSQPNSSETADTLITIPVVVHIIHNGEPVGSGQNLSDAQVLAQIEQLNLDFSATNPEFSQTPNQWKSVRGTPKIEFCLAKVDPNGNPTTGIVRHQLQVTGTSWTNNNINSEIKPQTIWDPLHYYNVWVLPIPGTTADGGVVGFANYPLPGQVGSNTDGAVIDYRWFGGPGFSQSSYRVLQHESGHYLGLPHPWDGDNCFDDDGIDDTPNVDAPTSEYAELDCSDGYPVGPTSCGNEHMYVNHMDYVNHNCYTSFTQGQANVMRAVLQGTNSGFNYTPRTELAAGAWARCNLPAHNATLVQLEGPAERMCTADSVVPIIRIRNSGTDPLDSLWLFVQTDTQLDSLLWQGYLPYGDTAVVALPPFLPQGNTFQYSIWAAYPDSWPDEQPHDDSIQINGIYISPAPLPFAEDFDTTLWNPTLHGVFHFNINGDDFTWQYANGISAWGVGSGCAVFDNFTGTQANNPFGTSDALITPVFDLAQVNGPVSLAFDVAYAQFNDTFSDTLWIGVSTNCGQLFDQPIFLKGGAELSTAPPQTTAFVPTPDQWRTETIDLSAFSNEADLSFAFLNLSSWGNRLYIDNIRLILPCGLTVSLSANDASCANTCDGSISAAINGAWGQATYQWSHGLPNTAEVSSLCADTYSLTLTDENGCTTTASTQVAAPAPITISLSANDESAQGANDGSISSQVSGGTPPYTYNWSNGSQAPQIQSLSPGTYSLTITDARGCTQSASAEVLPYSCPNMSATVNAQNPSCFGTADGSIAVFPQGGQPPYSYNWSNGASLQSLTGLLAGTYSVTIGGADGCQLVQSITLNDPPELVVQTTVTHETAPSAQDGSVEVLATGGTPPYTYTWSNGGSSAQQTGLAPGTYSVTVTDAQGCAQVTSATVSAAGCTLNLSISTTPPTCPNSQNGMAVATANGGTGNYTFNWSNGQTGNPATGLGEGIWSVTVTDETGCALTQSFTLTAIDTTGPTLITHDVTLWLDANGQATLSPFTALAAATDDCGIADLSITPNQFNCSHLGAQTAVLTATDVSGNVSTAIINVTVLDGVVPIVVCPPDITVYQCAGPLDYALPQVTDNCTAELTQLEGPAPGAFFPQGTTQLSWQISDDSGFSHTCTWTITLQYDLQASVQLTPPSCPGSQDGSAQIAVSGGQAPYTFEWGNATSNMLEAGTYTVTINDANGCSITTMFTLEDPPALMFAELSATPETNGQQDGMLKALAQGGTPPYTYFWYQDGQLIGTGVMLEGIAAGTYQCQVVDDHGCVLWSEDVIVESVTATTSLQGRLPITFHPNPAHTYLLLSGIGTAENVQWSLWAADGRLLHHTQQQVTSDVLRIDISALPPGVYILRLSTQMGFAVRRFAKQ